MVNDRHVLVLYTTAVCNLKCVYCYIDKNPALKKIDDILDESFKGEYYTNFVKKMFPYKHQLTEVQIWGGEPTLRLDRAYHTVDNLIKIYPNLNHFMMSTNFTGANWFEQFYGFTDILGKYPDKKFIFDLQLSIDGPTPFNDRQRGKGVTKSFTEHFLELCKTSNDRIPNNVTVNIFFKPTLTAELFPKLQTREAVTNYYLFFENYYAAYHKITQNKEKLHLSYSIPNTACPSPHTKEDGLLFANFCKISNEITKDQKHGNGPFKYYRDIVCFRRNGNRICYDNLDYKCGNGHCGSGYNVIGLLPDNLISSCHSGFTDLLEEYKKYCMTNDAEHAIDPLLFMNDTHCMIHKVDDFDNFERLVAEFYEQDSTFKLANMASVVKILALNGQVDAQYKTNKGALKGAYFVQQSTAYCIRDNVGTSGSAVLPSVGLFKLLLNGAREYIEDVGM